MEANSDLAYAFIPAKRGEKFSLEDPFETERVFVWLDNINSPDRLNEIQKEILAYREQIQKKAAGLLPVSEIVSDSCRNAS